MKNIASAKSSVLAVIRKNGDNNLFFADLEEKSGLDFNELIHAIGLLAKENRLLIRINHSMEGCQTNKFRGDTLYAHFMDLVFVYHKHHRNVKFYASKLCVSVQYLSAVVSKVSGNSPSAWIKKETIGEIKRMLCHTQASVKEIAYEFNFPNISFFCKFFKSHTGLSPGTYRKITQMALHSLL